MQKKYLRASLISLGIVGATLGSIQPAPCPPKQNDASEATAHFRAAQKSSDKARASYNPVLPGTAGSHAAQAVKHMNKGMDALEREVLKK